ncbi:MAG: hypothetical protein NTW48_04400 [Chloroflexi bacterium]|nr:hypothetical protein [Chloroflexota bacterium]
MPKVQKHQYCPKASLREITTPRGIRLMCPMGDVKTVYYRKGKTWRRIGTLCLNCLWFDPDHNFMSATTHPPREIPPL